MKEIDRVCEKNCPDYLGMEILHKEQCDCSCHNKFITENTKEITMKLKKNIGFYFEYNVAPGEFNKLANTYKKNKDNSEENIEVLIKFGRLEIRTTFDQLILFPWEY